MKQIGATQMLVTTKQLILSCFVTRSAIASGVLLCVGAMLAVALFSTEVLAKPPSHSNGGGNDKEEDDGDGSGSLPPITYEPIWLTPGLASRALGMNGLGDIVGRLWLDDADELGTAFLRKSQQVIILNDVLSTTEQAEWDLIQPRAINDSGQIAGRAYPTVDRVQEVWDFRLTPTDSNGDGVVDHNDEWLIVPLAEDAVWDINEAGDIVAGDTLYEDDGVGNLLPVSLDALTGRDIINARAIKDTGQVAYQYPVLHSGGSREGAADPPSEKH